MTEMGQLRSFVLRVASGGYSPIDDVGPWASTNGEVDERRLSHR
jgi:hypothetical protein